MSQPRNPVLIHTQPAQEQLHVAGLVVHSRPQRMEATVDWLQTRGGVEIHAQSDRGKLVVVMESRRAHDILDLIDDAREQPGIVDAALIYHEIVAPDEEDAR